MGKNFVLYVLVSIVIVLSGLDLYYTIEINRKAGIGRVPKHHQVNRMGRKRGTVGKSKSISRLFDKENMRQICQILSQYYPEWRELKEIDNPRVERMVRRKLFKSWHRVRLIIEAHKQDPDLAEKLVEDEKLERKIDDLAKQYRTTKSEKKREELKSQITHLLSQQFRTRQWIRERRLRNLEKEIERIERDLKKRDRLREKLIQRRLRQILGESAEIEW